MMPPSSCTTVAIMERFDALPPAVRKVIREAEIGIHPRVAEWLLRRGLSESRCVAAIKAVDRRLCGGVRQ